MPQFALVVIATISLALSGCNSAEIADIRSITFTSLPPAKEGSPDQLYPIAGVVRNAQPGERIVLYARSGIWWVQPTEAEPFSEIAPDSRWNNFTHPGNAYAALLVTSGYRPQPRVETLPEVGGAVLAVEVAEQQMLALPSRKTIDFSGFEWQVRDVASDRGGTRNLYYPSNVWVDEKGFLHLRIARKDNQWTAAEVSLAHSLGYGTYRIQTQSLAHLEPAAVFSVFTWDDTGPTREMDIEVSRWGEAEGKNAQFVVQPYFVPANAMRFQLPDGPLSLVFQWEPERVTFEAGKHAARGTGALSTVATHVFTSSVPAPGNEKVHLNLYVFANPANPLRNECEVVIEKFEYFP